MNMLLHLNNHMPEYVRAVIDKLNLAGYEAYAVGGCVRDILLGKTPHDWDICTKANPEQILSVFDGERTLKAGMKHGTVSVVKESGIVEITSYRIDGSYNDGRHPDNVIFTNSLREDLARRDFTINAMALDINGNIYDPWNGQKDLENRTIRCVGEPRRRFEEDALRMLRALRFSSVLGFDIESETSGAIHGMTERLELISAERKREELFKLLCGEEPERSAEYRDVISQIISPPCCDDRELYENCLHTAARTKKDVITRLAVVFNGDTDTHCRSALEQLRCDKKTVRDTVCTLICSSEKPAVEKDELTEALYITARTDGGAIIERCLDINRAKGKISDAEYAKASDNLRNLLSDEEACYTLSQLKINGDSLMKLGISGKEAGEILRELLREVVYKGIENSEQKLIKQAESLYKKAK